MSVLTQEEVIRILELVDKLESSSFEYVELRLGDMILTLKKGKNPPLSDHGEAIFLERIEQHESKPAVEVGWKDQQQRQSSDEESHRAETVEHGRLVPIRAPIVGRFYAAPEPDAPAFVQVGDRVEEDTTVALLEVMKVFHTVKAGITGVIRKVCVKNGDLVEYGQEMFLVDVDGDVDGKE